MRRPPMRKRRKRLRVDRPIVQGGRIEVGSVRPHKSVDFGINAYLIEEIQIAQGTKQFAAQDRLEINDLLSLVVEAHAQGVRSVDSICPQCHAKPLVPAR